MRTNQPLKQVFIISLFMISSLTLIAQAPINYSGKWQYDKSKSDKEETGNGSFDGTIVMEIKQDSKIITFGNTFFRRGKDPYVMQPDSFYVDGRVTKDDGGTGPAKKFVKWSADKKILTTNLIMTDEIDGVKQDFLDANTYKLSDDKKTLTIEKFTKSKLNGEGKIKEVYNKK